MSDEPEKQENRRHSWHARLTVFNLARRSTKAVGDADHPRPQVSDVSVERGGLPPRPPKGQSMAVGVGQRSAVPDASDTGPVHARAGDDNHALHQPSFFGRDGDVLLLTLARIYLCFQGMSSCWNSRRCGTLRPAGISGRRLTAQEFQHGREHGFDGTHFLLVGEGSKGLQRDACCFYLCPALLQRGSYWLIVRAHIDQRGTPDLLRFDWWPTGQGP